MEQAIELQSTIGGRYRFEVRREDHSIKEEYEFDNLITDGGFTYVQSNAISLAVQYCRVGSGSTTPSVSDTQLVSQVASATNTSSTTSALTSSPYTSSYTVTYQFALGAAAGNLSEVGVGWAATGTTLYSRALILDGLGNPTTITVLSNEYLYVYYTAYINPPLTDGTGTLTISGTSYTWTSRAANAGNTTYWSIQNSFQQGGYVNTVVSNGGLGPITGNITGTQYIGVGTPTGTAASGVVSYTLSIPPASGNLPVPITAMGPVMIGPVSYQFQFSPGFAKNTSNTLTLNFSHTITRI